MAKKVQDAVDYASQLYENGRLSKTRTLIHLPDGSTAVQRDDLGPVRNVSRDPADLPVVKTPRP